jgi:hypothetical protein
MGPEADWLLLGYLKEKAENQPTKEADTPLF